MSNLLEQWNEHIIRGNQLSRELEDFEGIMHVADMPECKVAICDGNGTTYIDRVLSTEKMAEIKQMVVATLIEARSAKEIELEKLMGVRKPAIINPEFEAAVHGMVQSVKKQPDPIKGKLSTIIKDEVNRISKPQEPIKPSELLENFKADIEKMYKEDMATVGAIADKYGVKKTEVNTFLAKHKLFRRSYKKDDDFLDAKVEARQKQSGKERP